jgi:catechol 2,3-dioxygenase-like lactoylglutathione lyase family enzyme
MALVQEFGYAAYGVSDLDAAVGFFREVCGLGVSERRDGVAFVTGDTRHAWLRLEERPTPGLIRLGFRATDDAAIAEVKSRLDQQQIPWTAGGAIKQDRVHNAIRFTAPQAIEVELYEEMVQLPVSPAPARGIERLLHAVVFVGGDVIAARDFWTRTLGFRRSDQIEDLVVFLRCGNRYHHSIGLAKGEPGRLDHVCMLVDDVDTVVRFRNHARAAGVKTEDLVRHTASGSISVYLQEPTLGLGVEYCHGHDVIADDDYNGRLLKAGPVTVDRWSGGFPDATPLNPVVGGGGGTSAADLAVRAGSD